MNLNQHHNSLWCKISEKNEVHLMKFKVVIHAAEEGGYCAKVPAIPGCATQGETSYELLENI